MATQVQKDRNDLFTAIAVGAIIIAWLVYSSIRSIVDLFATPGAVTVSARVPLSDVTVAIGSGAAATTDWATLVVPDLNMVSTVSFVIAIVVRALTLIAATVLAVILCRRLWRGVVFDRTNARMTSAMSLLMLAAALGGMFFENMGLNGVFAALGGEHTGQWRLLSDEAPLLVASIAVGVLVIVFLRGDELRKDQEGLV